MTTVQDILRNKGSFIHSIGVDATVLEAIRMMNQHRIGALVVMSEDQVAGIFTERDVMQRVVLGMRDPLSTIVGEVMTADVICCEPEDDLDEISSIMRSARVRHLPVCGPEGQLLGLVSIGDINASHASRQEQTIHFLHEYIYGRA